jgi:1-acyl-sn-glycerol-3-phosphate acyltransferase
MEPVPVTEDRATGGRDPFDADYCRRVIGEVFRPILDHWFRPRLIGAGRIPARGPVILAPNHSGMAFPYDGIVLDALLWLRDGTRLASKFRSLFEKQLALTWWMRPFGLDNFWRRCGGIDGSFDNFEHLLSRGDRVIYYPEGVPGIGKGFQNRYRLQRFSTSFAVLAARHGVPVVPVHVVNAEWLIPFTFTLRPIDRLMQGLFGVPFLPLPAAPFAMVFPWAWWMALPCRMIFVVGEPIDVAALAREEGLDPRQPDRAVARRVADRVRVAMQPELDRAVRRYGARPYQRRSLWRALRAARRRGVLARTLPTGWTAAFVRFGRDAERPPARNGLHRLLRDWDLIGYYLPFGWPLLSLSRALRRPPCGYRGLDPAARRERQGAYVWRLSERPLPPRHDRD